MLGHQMAFRWRADDDPLLWFPSPTKTALVFFCQSQNSLDPRLLRERERERERERAINQRNYERTNSLTNIGKDEQTNGKTKLYTPRHKRWGITSVDLDILFRIFKDRMSIVTRNTPLKHWNNTCPDQPAHHRSYRRLCLYIKQ